MPFSHSIGVSRKIQDPDDRNKLKELGVKLREKYSFGFIMRTAAAEATEQHIYEETELLIAKWSELVKEFKKAKKVKLLYKESDSDEFLLREFLNKGRRSSY